MLLAGELKEYKAEETMDDLWPVRTSNCLLAAVKCGDVEGVEVLLENGADVNALEKFQMRIMTTGEVCMFGCLRKNFGFSSIVVAKVSTKIH